MVGCIDVVKLKNGNDVKVFDAWSGDELLDVDGLLLEPPDNIPLTGGDMEVGCCINVNWPSGKI